MAKTLRLKTPPLARLAEARYARFLGALLGLWRARVVAVFEDTPDVPPTRAELEAVWAELTAERVVMPVLRRVLHEADQASALYWRKLSRVRAPRAELERTWLAEQIRILGALGRYQIDALVGAVRGDAREPKAVTEARKANVALIQGLDLKQHMALVDLLKGAQKTGQRHETLVSRVQEITGAGLKRAKLIARDQTVKHNAAVNQAQAKASGIVEYTWRSTHDNACRRMHRELDGTVHRYDDPPITNEAGDRNNPGEDYNCRCQAEPKPPQEVTDLFAGLADPEFETLGF